MSRLTIFPCRSGPGRYTVFSARTGPARQQPSRCSPACSSRTAAQSTINGHDLAQDPTACKQDTGYIPDRPWLYEKLTGMEFLQFIASLYKLDKHPFQCATDHFLKLFDLYDWRDHLIESYSHGMRQKLIMTSVLMQDQPLMVIDEPMVGLDPKSARLVKEMFKQKARSGTAIFLSTHSLEIAEELCHRIAIITEGKLRITGTMETLRNEAGREGFRPGGHLPGADRRLGTAGGHRRPEGPRMTPLFKPFLLQPAPPFPARRPCFHPGRSSSWLSARPALYALYLVSLKTIYLFSQPERTRRYPQPENIPDGLGHRLHHAHFFQHGFRGFRPLPLPGQ